MSDARILLILIPGLPLLASIATAVFGRILGERSHWPALLSIAVSFLCAVGLGAHVYNQMELPSTATIGYEEVHTLWTWAQVDGAYDQDGALVPTAATLGKPTQRELRIDVSLRADALTSIMLIMVTFISTLVVFYSSGYMHGDRSYWRFFAYVALFVFSMTMLVSVSNFLMLFVFWEAVGVCSYLLIGFWYEKPAAAAAGKKAFLVNRVGDFGFALGLFLIWTCYGTLNYHDTETSAGVLGQLRLAQDAYIVGWPALAICLLLMVGACGKSAQFPLHVWLADAMEGPTPVSALIHAATMVTAGVYMVTRCTPLFMASPDAQLAVASIGGGTALMAGLIALTQYDLKRVLAYSTISQLGYMFLGLGAGTLVGITAGMFHLFTHAFFKALLFLGAGSVMHSMGGVIDMRRFGGLRRIMPITCATFAVGCIALAGVFPLSGFWSKDSILGAIHDQAHDMQVALEHAEEPDEDNASAVNNRIHLVAAEIPTAGHTAGDGNGDHGQHLAHFTPAQLARGAKVYQFLYYLGIFTALLTAIYTFRALFMTFFGNQEVPHEAGHHAHESPLSMWVPLAILAVCAACVGWAVEWPQGIGENAAHPFSTFLANTPSLAYEAVQATPHPGHFHADVALISTLIALLGIGVAAFLYLGHQREASAVLRLLDWKWLSPYKLSSNKFYWDEFYNGLIVRPLLGLAQWCYAVDRFFVDGFVNVVGWLPKAFGGLMRNLQVGVVPFYGLIMVLGTLTLIAAGVLWGGK